MGAVEVASSFEALCQSASSLQDECASVYCQSHSVIIVLLISMHIHINANENGTNIQYPWAECVLCTLECVFSMDINNLELPDILVELNCSCFCIPRQKSPFYIFPCKLKLQLVGVENFKYLGVTLNEDNNNQIELQERINNANKTYFRLQNFF
jgi:hypothetical protein